ncbi:hypothetical protein A9299_04295 [Moraxella osloensis]|uniref:Uncharacterized protein n=1 Tax=Faucicola osloensis TaxID=34062 RepID=A0AA91J9F8_FAUOS|nr:hypothetical protein [Moraxella osloensis]OBX62419.1 hypothetical protein A9299_04295 [Moraxella osloensis]
MIKERPWLLFFLLAVFCLLFLLDVSIGIAKSLWAQPWVIGWLADQLGRVPNSEQSIFNGLKMPKSGKTALNCLTIFQYYLHNLPCFAGDLVYF